MLAAEVMRLMYEVLLTVAIAIALYIRWNVTGNFTSAAILSTLAVFLLAVSCALGFSEDCKRLGRILFHFMASLLTGILAFSAGWKLQDGRLHFYMNLAFLLGILSGWYWKLLHVLRNERPSKIKLLPVSHCLKSLGLVIASLTTGVDTVAVSLFTLAYIFNVLAMRLKSPQGFIGFLVFGFFSSLYMKPHISTFVCFLDPHVFQSLLVSCLGKSSSLDRWRSFLDKSHVFRFCSVVLLLCMEVIFIAVVGYAAVRHTTQHTDIILIFTFCVSLLWLILRPVVFFMLWTFMDKITACKMTADEDFIFSRALAAKGLRMFGLVTEPFMKISLALLFILLVLGLWSATPYHQALTFLVLPAEAAIAGLFNTLRESLGGTWAGCAVSAPVTSYSLKSEDASTRTNATLARLKLLFTSYKVQNVDIGVDATAPLVLNNLQSKLKAFFSRRTDDGMRFDSYLLYFSGEVHDTGDWVLSDKKRLSFEQLLSWWQEEDMNSGSRLLLLLDTAYSFKWVDKAAFVKECPLAIQTCRYASWPDSTESMLGCFTRAYVELNIKSYLGEIPNATSSEAKSSTAGQEVAIPASFSEYRPIRALYEVSRGWYDSSFYRPEPSEVRQYMISLFGHKMVRLFGSQTRNERPGYTNRALSWLRWLWMLGSTHQHFDTGNGLQLIKADNILTMVSERFLFYEKMLQEYQVSANKKDTDETMKEN